MKSNRTGLTMALLRANMNSGSIRIGRAKTLQKPSGSHAKMR